MDMSVRLVPLKFSPWATIEHHGPSIHSGHYTASINCCKKNIILLRSHNYGVWNYCQQRILYCICYTIWIDLTHDFLTRTGGWGFDRSHGVGTSSSSHWKQVEEQAPKPVGWMICFLLTTFVPVQKLCVNIYIYIYIYKYIYILFYMSSVFFALLIVSCSLMINNCIIPGCFWLLSFVLNNTLVLGIWCSTIPHLPGCFCSWTFFQNIGFNMVPSDPCMSHLATQLGYSAGEFQALQLIVLVTFGVVD